MSATVVVLLLLLALVVMMLVLASFGVRASFQVIRAVLDRALSRPNNLEGLDPKLYTAFHDVVLPMSDGGGSTKVDLVVVSRYGIFVIETRELSGSVRGHPERRYWTVTDEQGVRNRLFNPFLQSALHTHALAEFLDVDRSSIESLVFLTGDHQLRSELGPDVISHTGLVPRIEHHRTPRFERAEVVALNDTLREHQRTAPRRRSYQRRLPRPRQESDAIRPGLPPAH